MRKMIKQLSQCTGRAGEEKGEEAKEKTVERDEKSPSNVLS